MLKFEQCHINNGGFTLLADMSVPQGAQVAVLGPSGAGKSTLLEAIAGFCPITSGKLSWRDQDLTRQPPGDRPVTMLFQDSNLFPHLTAAQNVALGIKPKGRLTPKERVTIQDALHRVGLDGLAERRPAQLSGGQQSRVALARVLVQRREVLLLDEPFSALGPALKAEMLDLVAAMTQQEHITLLMISHDPTDARRITNNTILIENGHAHAPQPTSEILDNPPPSLQAYLG